MIERERKFLLPIDFSFDGLKRNNVFEIAQYYLSNGGRVRMRNDVNTDYVEYFFTIKYPSIHSELECVEIEKSIPKDIFDNLKEQSIGGIQKMRYVITSGIHKLEIDRFYTKDGIYLLLMEVEYNDGEKIIIPECINKQIIRDVTGENKFYNKELAKNTDRKKLYE